MAEKKTRGRLGRRYRVMWDQNSGQEMYYNPPIDAERIAQGHFGFFEGRPVDAYVGAMGSNAGFTVGWPTKVKNAEFIVERMQRGGRVGDVKLWRHAENLRLAWEAGIDPEEVKIAEARRIGVDFWFRLAMNDWHHWGASNEETNLWSADFFVEHPEYLIGEEGAHGWPENLWKVLRYFQDFAHEEVRRLRHDLAVEACERYDLDGFLFDFMRCPGYFKKGEEEAGAVLMSDLVRETRSAFERIERDRGRPLGFAVRVPNTIAGSEGLGLDVRNWVKEGLVDLVVPSCFFGQDTEEDITEWVDLVGDTDVLLYPAIEEGYLAGHSGSFQRWYLKPPIMAPLTVEMIRAIAGRHLSKGADGLYVFNFFGTAPTYDYDNREALDDIAGELRLAHKDKTYVVMRSNESFPNCLETRRQIPATLTAEPLEIWIEVADDLTAVRSRLEAVRLRVHVENLTVYDELEVTLNDEVLTCANPMRPGAYTVYPQTPWFIYDLMDHLPARDYNRFTLRMAKRNERLAGEIAVTVEDVELEVRYEYPNGAWYPQMRTSQTRTSPTRVP